MAEKMAREDVARLLRRVHQVLAYVLDIGEPALITPKSMKLLLDLYVHDLSSAVRQEREGALLRDWKQQRAEFRKQWLNSPHTDKVQFRGDKHLVITEAATDATHKKCHRKKGADYPEV